MTTNFAAMSHGQIYTAVKSGTPTTLSNAASQLAALNTTLSGHLDTLDGLSKSMAEAWPDTNGQNFRSTLSDTISYLRELQATHIVAASSSVTQVMSASHEKLGATQATIPPPPAVSVTDQEKTFNKHLADNHDAMTAGTAAESQQIAAGKADDARAVQLAKSLANTYLVEKAKLTTPPAAPKGPANNGAGTGATTGGSTGTSSNHAMSNYSATAGSGSSPTGPVGGGTSGSGSNGTGDGGTGAFVPVHNGGGSDGWGSGSGGSSGNGSGSHTGSTSGGTLLDPNGPGGANANPIGGTGYDGSSAGFDGSGGSAVNGLLGGAGSDGGASGGGGSDFGSGGFGAGAFGAAGIGLVAAGVIAARKEAAQRASQQAALLRQEMLSEEQGANGAGSLSASQLAAINAQRNGILAAGQQAGLMNGERTMLASEQSGLLRANAAMTAQEEAQLAANQRMVPGQLGGTPATAAANGGRTGMPFAGGGVVGGAERVTWLVEDRDLFSADPGVRPIVAD